MNPHHLELFYFVAKYEGITEAVRKMPYGIQQPAVSGQILQLENHLGVKLFRRRPFALTPAGEELYEFIEPFFSQLDYMKERLSGEGSQHLRLAANASALTHHLPQVLRILRDNNPDLRLTLKEMTATEVETALLKHEADIALAVLHHKPVTSIKIINLIDFRLVLLAPDQKTVKTFDDITGKALNGKIREPLIALPSNEPLMQVFQKGLIATGKFSWEPTMEVSELTVVHSYVSTGFGYGLAVEIPGVPWPAGIKSIPLPDEFPRLSLGMLYTGDLKPIAEQFAVLTKRYADELNKAS